MTLRHDNRTAVISRAPDKAAARILLVDDDPKFRSLGAAKLSGDGHDVVEVASGEDAWKKIQTQSYSLVIFDLKLPHIDGFTLIERIRDNASTRHLPIIVLTSDTDPRAINKAYSVGATSYLTKPVNWDLLGHQVRSTLKASHTEEELRTAREVAEGADRMKDNLIKVMGHELRTPLHQIIGFAEVVQQKLDAHAQDPNMHEFVDSIADAGHQLLSTLGDMMMLSRLLSGNVAMEEERYTPEKLIERTLVRLPNEISRREISVHFDDTGIDEARVQCDSRLVTYAIANLVSNAVKFSPEDTDVTVTAMREPDGAASFVVRDHGVGMDQTAIDSYLKPFAQAENPLIRSSEGAGLGLAISKAIAELHGGHLTIQSSQEAGTTASINFPNSRVTQRTTHQLVG